jgi:3-oxoacyl-[acyl-carrier-protein] synthase III
LAIIESIGAYIPEKMVSTAELIAQIKDNPPFFIEAFTGIVHRRYRAQHEDSYSIGLKAARTCLRHSKYNAEDLNLIIYAGITRFKDGMCFQFEPPLALDLKNELGAEQAMAFDISNACAGMITGVFILDNMIKAGAIKRGMVISGECITSAADTAVLEISELRDPRLASLTLGDAGAAVIIDEGGQAPEGIQYTSMATYAEYSDLCLGMPSDRNVGLAMYADSVTLHNEAQKRAFLAFKTKSISAEFGRPIDYLIPHQTSIRAINKVFKEFKAHFNISAEERPHIAVNIKEFGNTASTSHFLTLYQKLMNGEIAPGSTCLLGAAASGIVIGYMAVTLGAVNKI